MDTGVICSQPGRNIGWPTIALRSTGELLAIFSDNRDLHVCPWDKQRRERDLEHNRTHSRFTTRRSRYRHHRNKARHLAGQLVYFGCVREKRRLSSARHHTQSQNGRALATKLGAAFQGLRADLGRAHSHQRLSTARPDSTARRQAALSGRGITQRRTYDCRRRIYGQWPFVERHRHSLPTNSDRSSWTGRTSPGEVRRWDAHRTFPHRRR